MWEIVMIFKMSYSVFVLFTGIEPTQAPPFIPHLRGGSLLAEKINKHIFLVFPMMSCLSQSILQPILISFMV